MYHISLNDLGNSVKMEPRLCSQDDVDIKRICVAPTIACCLSASSWFDFWDDSIRDIHVYKASSGSTIPVPCTDKIPDRHLTDEHWYLDSTYFVKKYVIEHNSVLFRKLANAAISCWGHMYDRAICRDLETQEKELKVFNEILSQVDWEKDLIKTSENIDNNIVYGDAFIIEDEFEFSSF